MKKTIGKAKGVCCFAVDWQTLRVQCEKQELRICVAAKKKLNFFEHRRGEFMLYVVAVGRGCSGDGENGGDGDGGRDRVMMVVLMVCR